MAGRLLCRACEGAVLRMIYEYALEPELVASWTDRRDVRYFKNSFGRGQGRLVSRFPKRWKKLVWDALEDTDDLARKRVEELLACLSEAMVHRGHINWHQPPVTWLENAEHEHQRQPFRAILARTNPRSHSAVLTGADLDVDGRWVVSRGRSVSRNAQAMAKAMEPVLQCSSVIIFVDPHFSPEQLKYRRPFQAFLERMVSQRLCDPPKRVEVHTGVDKGEGFFRAECDARLPECVPEGVRVLLRRLRQRTDGEKFHNRYILTDLGGVSFGTGLDEGDDGETDDLTLMDGEPYRQRWSQYSGNPPTGFEQDGAPVEVLGTRKISA